MKDQLSTLEAKLKKLKIRHALEEVDDETYKETLDYLKAQMQMITE